MNILAEIARLNAPCVVVSLATAGVRIPPALERLASGDRLAIDLGKVVRLRWDPEWRWFSFGTVIERAFIPAEAVTIAVDSTGAVVAAQRPH